MEINKENTISIIGTISIHLVLFLLLLFYYLKPNSNDLNDTELSGVPVMFGNVSDAFGKDIPAGNGNGTLSNVEDLDIDKTKPNLLENEISETTKDRVPKSTQKLPSKEKKSDIQTQNVEKTVTVPDHKKEDKKAQQQKEAVSKEKKQIQEAETKKKNEEQAKKSINSQLAGVFGNGSGSGSRGNTQGSGTQGSPSGNGNEGKISGIGGRGSYDLGGRGVGATGLILPSYDVDDYGTVVIDIIVDSRGNVVEVSIGRGTTTSNTVLRNESLRAARKTKFKTISSSNNQRGTITYRFNLN